MLNNIIRNIDYLPTILFIVSAIIWRTPYYTIGLYVLLPIIIIYSFVKYRNLIISSIYWKPYLLLLIWMFLSSFLNDNTANSLNVMISVFATFLLSFSILSLSQNGSNGKMIELGFFALFVAILYTTITSGHFSTSFDYSNETERRGNTELNSNQYAYFSLFAIMAIRLLIGKSENKRLYLRSFLYLALGAMAFWVALLTASRQVLLTEIPVIVFFIFYDFIGKGAAVSKYFILFGLIIVAFFLSPHVLDLYDNSYLAVRSNERFQEDERYSLLLIGLQQGLDNPFWGLGFGADVAYTHCTYTHLLARCGIPALLLYIHMIYTSIKQQLYRYRETNDRYFFLLFFLTVIFAYANFFYSYINQPFMMTILFLIVGESNLIYNQFYYKIEDN